MNSEFQPLNLALDVWLPVRRQNGRTETVAPWQVTDGIAAGDPVAMFAWPRPDFDAAAHEFMIGLLATTMAPGDDIDWEEFWDAPPAPEILRRRFESVAYAFSLDGDGPRFMQDPDPLDDGTEQQVAQLLIDSPGENALKKNADLFVKRDQIGLMGRAAAAIALFTLQTYAPAGGVGHRTSLRGGGPLTTLGVGQHPDRRVTTLWDRLWPNVESRTAIEERRIGRKSADRDSIFPWLRPTRTSDAKAGGGPVNPAKVDPLHVYWAVPRRVRLAFECANEHRCDLTGTPDKVFVRSYRTRNYGAQYESDGFIHPLSPYYRQKKEGHLLPLHPRPGGVSYRNWLGLLVSDEDGLSKPALTVSAIERRRMSSDQNGHWRLVTFGFYMDNMKVCGWVQSEASIGSFSEHWTIQRFERAVRRLVRSADIAARMLTYQVKSALFDKPSDAPGDFSFMAERFWRDTEGDFHKTLDRMRQGREANPGQADLDESPLREWSRALRTSALSLFDEYAPMDGIENGAMGRLVKGRWYLVSTFNGVGKTGEQFLGALGLETPKAKKSRTKRTERAT